MVNLGGGRALAAEPVPLLSVSYSEIPMVLTVVGAVLGATAIILASRAYSTRDRSHYAASGFIAGVLAVEWGAKLFLTGA